MRWRSVRAASQPLASLTLARGFHDRVESGPVASAARQLAVGSHPETCASGGGQVDRESRQDRAARAAASDAPEHATQKSVVVSRMPQKERDWVWDGNELKPEA